jgi:hypothetical protein
MLAQDAIGKVPVGISLGVVAGILVVSVVASLLKPPKQHETSVHGEVPTPS